MAINARLDHLVIAADTLESGRNWARQELGVDVPPGGKHDRMATHNAVGRIAAPAFGPDVYLEIIATDPDAQPQRRRWFFMDDAAIQESLKRDGPRVLHWVARCSDLDSALGAVREHGVDPGTGIEMSRGDLRWRIAVRDDGALPFAGLLPTLIEWPAGPHPCQRMAELPLTLSGLSLITDQPDALQAILQMLGLESFVEVVRQPGTPAIVANWA